jgi:DNA-directed RNA polymerase specialized sigma24 family protein
MVDHATPAQIVSETEEHAVLWRVARQTLKPEAFDVLWMKYREQLSIAEIAGIMNRSETSVKVMLHRARKNLGNALESSEAKIHPNSKNSISAVQQLNYNKGSAPCSA